MDGPWTVDGGDVVNPAGPGAPANERKELPLSKHPHAPPASIVQLSTRIATRHQEIGPAAHRRRRPPAPVLDQGLRFRTREGVELAREDEGLALE